MDVPKATTEMCSKHTALARLTLAAPKRFPGHTQHTSRQLSFHCRTAQYLVHTGLQAFTGEVGEEQHEPFAAAPVCHRHLLSELLSTGAAKKCVTRAGASSILVKRCACLELPPLCRARLPAPNRDVAGHHVRARSPSSLRPECTSTPASLVRPGPRALGIRQQEQRATMQVAHPGAPAPAGAQHGVPRGLQGRSPLSRGNRSTVPWTRCPTAPSSQPAGPLIGRPDQASRRRPPPSPAPALPSSQAPPRRRCSCCCCRPSTCPASPQQEAAMQKAHFQLELLNSLVKYGLAEKHATRENNYRRDTENERQIFPDTDLCN